MNAETPGLCESVNNTTEVRCSFPIDYQVTISLRIRTSTIASNIGLRKQPQNFHLSVDFQGHQAEVSFREANAPQSRDDTSGLTAKAPTYDAAPFNRNSCRPPTRLAKKPNHTTTHTHRSGPYGKRRKQATSIPQDMGRRILSQDEQELQVAPEKLCNNGKAVQMSFYGEKDLENLSKGLPRSRH